MTVHYGARLTDHTPPNGAIHVRAGAPLDAPGTITEPMGDPQRAILRCPAGGTVVGAGDFPYALVQQWRRPITIQPYPGEQFRLIGSDPARDWHRDGDMWWHQSPMFDHTPNGDILDPARPWASWPEQLWQDLSPMRMVSPAVPPGPGEFNVQAGGRLYISDNPEDSDMRVAVRSTAFSGSLDMETGTHPPATLWGIEAWHHATQSLDRAAIKVYGESVVQDVTVVEGSAAGISVMRSTGGTVANCTMRGMGQLGAHSYLAEGLELAWCLIEGNNRKGFATIGEAGGAKWSNSPRAHAHHNLLLGNHGHGLWADLDSDEAWYYRNDIDGGQSAGIMFELGKDGRAYGNRVTGCAVGILISGSASTTVAHNTCTGNGVDIRLQPDRRRPAQEATHTVRGNVTTGTIQADVTPTFEEADVLELTEAEAAVEHTGWYGPVHTTPEPPEESPVYDVEPFNHAVEGIGHAQEGVEEEGAALVAEIRRLEAVIANDDHLATIETLTAELEATARHLFFRTIELNAANGTITSQQDTIAAQQAMIADMAEMISAVTVERDTAQAALEETQELLAEAQAIVDDRASLIAAQLITIKDQEAQIAAMQVHIDDLQRQLTECQNPPTPLDAVIVGGSHKNGWQALKAMTAPVMPGAYRKFIAGPRITVKDMETIDGVIADQAIPFISPGRSTPADLPGAPSPDTVHNVQALIDAGHDDWLGVWIPMHEPTQKGITAAEYQTMLEADLPYIREHLPSWKPVPTFQGFDFADPDLERYPANWLPDDLTLIDGIGVDVYDKGPADQDGNGKALTELLANVIAFAQDRGLQIWIMETSAPDTGQYGRRAGWKRDWLAHVWIIVRDMRLPDGRRMFRSLLPFNSDVGPDAPPAVEGPPPVKKGWFWDSTPEALAAYRDVLTEADAT